MGILRTDRVTGLGGANAIKGSVFFDGGSTLTVEDSDDFHYDTGDFTIEGWIFATGRDSQMMLLGQWDGAGSVAGSLAWAVQLSNDSSGTLRFLTSSTGTNVVLNQTGSSGSVFDNKWHHFAVTRNGNDYKLFTDGVVVASTTDSNAITNSPFPLTIGGSNKRYVSNADSSQTFTGFLSNIRIIKGEALYTAAFTPPTSELTVTSNTVFLGCQSSNILREETGKILSIDKSSANNSGPISSRFTPNSPVGFSTTTDVGSQYGSTFDGFGSFATSTYMVPPGGNARERNRGRALWMGGYAPSNYRTMIDFVNIQSMGNAVEFGQLSGTSVGEGSECSSSTRAIQGGGSLVNTMEFVTIANTSNTIDFGDLTVARRSLDALSNETRGIWAGGTTNPAMSDVIDFATITTAGNATDFGNLTVGRRNMGTAASPTRGVFAGGNPGSSPLLDDTIDYITIASAGNAIDFGNLSAAFREGGGCSNGTRGVFAVGGPGSGSVNTMEFITIATTGNTTDYGDLFYAAGNLGGTSNGTRGVFGGGAGAAYTNIIQFITISTLGDAADFGDLTFTRIPYGATSDSHGGLS